LKKKLPKKSSSSLKNQKIKIDTLYCLPRCHFLLLKILERKKNWSTIREETKIEFFITNKKFNNELLAVKKNYPLNKKYTHFLRCMDKPFFFSFALCARMEKKSAIKKLNFCLNSDFFRSCFLKSKMKKKIVNPKIIIKKQAL